MQILKAFYLYWHAYIISVLILEFLCIIKQKTIKWREKPKCLLSRSLALNLQGRSRIFVGQMTKGNLGLHVGG